MLQAIPIYGEYSYTDLFIKNGTLEFANKIKTINRIGLILSGIHIHPMPHISCKFGNDIQRNKATVMILVKIKGKPRHLNFDLFKYLANQVISRK